MKVSRGIFIYFWIYCLNSNDSKVLFCNGENNFIIIYFLNKRLCIFISGLTNISTGKNMDPIQIKTDFNKWNFFYLAYNYATNEFIINFGTEIGKNVRSDYRLINISSNLNFNLNLKVGIMDVSYDNNLENLVIPESKMFNGYIRNFMIFDQFLNNEEIFKLYSEQL